MSKTPTRREAYAPSTLAVHAGALAPPATPPLDVPVYRASTFRFEDGRQVARYNAGGAEGLYLYGRYENPTVRALERRLAALEGAPACLAFASGMAALSTTVLALLSKGDRLLSSAAIYGGSHRFFRDHLPRFGVALSFLAPDALLRGAWPAGVRLVYAETPTNPALRVLDLPLLSKRARQAGALLVVDGTFATPVLQQPLALGADVVVHSATKALGGHSDLTAGAVLGSRSALAPIEGLRRALGGILSPDEAFLLSRSLKTLELRLLRQSATALALARRLARDRRVRRVFYPGLPQHPDHRVARRQLRAFGGLVTIELSGGLRAARRFFDRLELFARAVSLGGAESLASIPVETSHLGYSAAELARAGVTAGMVRLSVGLEDPDDLWRDLGRALGRA
ncbi:MAG: trans-sulfuration enzyme family protein [Myxococcales bacterium]